MTSCHHKGATGSSRAEGYQLSEFGIGFAIEDRLYHHIVGQKRSIVA